MPGVEALQSCTVFAPATVANVAVGFDVLGFAVDAVGDWVSVARSSRAGAVEIEGEVGQGIPTDPERNTATAGLLRFCRELALPFGFRVRIEKGIPLGSGMGGSAASAVGAIVAANELLEDPLPRRALLKYALIGEAVASGAVHGDNIAPCLLGGMTLVRSVAEGSEDVVSIPVPPGLLCVLVHPALRLDTRDSRAALRAEIPLRAHVAQSANLAGLIAGCFQGDVALIGRSLSDVLIEPQRARLIPGFEQVKAAALKAGALGCSISGSGPSVFAWVGGPGAEERALQVRAAMIEAFGQAGVDPVQAWISPVRAQGAAVI